MGRQLYRVPLDFDWPLKKVWRGYLMEDPPAACVACGEQGYNPATTQLADTFHGPYGWKTRLEQDEVDALIEHHRLGEFVEAFGAEYVTAEMVNLFEYDRQTASTLYPTVRFSTGHDSINRYICIEARAKRLGIFGYCNVCQGEGHVFRDEAHRLAYDDWQRTEPPGGDGYQLWETTSEGSPMSPVFPSLEQLCQWLADTGASTFGVYTANYDEWLRMLGSDDVVSIIIAGDDAGKIVVM